MRKFSPALSLSRPLRDLFQLLWMLTFAAVGAHARLDGKRSCFCEGSSSCPCGPEGNSRSSSSSGTMTVMCRDMRQGVVTLNGDAEGAKSLEEFLRAQGGVIWSKVPATKRPSRAWKEGAPKKAMNTFEEYMKSDAVCGPSYETDLVGLDEKAMLILETTNVNNVPHPLPKDLWNTPEGKKLAKDCCPR